MTIDLDRRARKQRLVAEVPIWFHSIDLGDGVITDGDKSLEVLADELATMNLPSLVGKSVLDIGAWDGFFSFEAERRGAARVVALDRHIWSIDRQAADDYAKGRIANGHALRRLEEVPELWDDDNLPGKRGFDICHQLFESRVQPVVADFMTMDLDALGTFDVVLYLGVLYHEPHPLISLDRLRSVTRELAVIESEMMYLPGLEAQPLAEFYPADELATDPSNWWVPNMAALIGFLRYAGFREVRVMKGPSPDYELLPSGHEPVHYRGIVHALT